MYNKKISDFQKLLNNFKIKLDFIHLVKEIELSPDSSLHEVETKQGTYFVYETDYVSDIKDIESEVEKYIGKSPEFIEVSNPLKSLEDIQASKFYISGKYPTSPDTIKNYLNDKDGTDSSTVTFLIKGQESLR